MSDFLDKALQSHIQWKLKLLASIAGNAKIDKATAGVDHLCELGQWIYGEGKRFEGVEEFRVLRAKHEKFHLCVRHVCEQIELGRIDEVRKEISAGGYKRASTETIDSILKLKALAIVA